MNLVLGAGIAGLSAAWHLSHNDCLILEQGNAFGGHARSIVKDGFTLDQGPHVSFTRHDYVRDLFRENVAGQFHDFPIIVANYYRNHLIEHPAQLHLWQLPEPLRAACATDMRSAAENRAAKIEPPQNYADWLRRSFGETFADTLPAAYTRKYWTVAPSALTADWVGPRMHTPSLDEIDASLVPGSRNKGYYIAGGRYPVTGGYQRFFERFADAANIRLGTTVARIDVARRRVTDCKGYTYSYDRLISTLPLPDFISLIPEAPSEIHKAAASLDCTELLLVDVFAPKVKDSVYRWFYVYDEEKLSTRIHCVESLSPANAPCGMTGIQVEVYSSRHRPATEAPHAVAKRVVNELVALGFVDEADLHAGRVMSSWRSCRHANVMFTHPRRSALNTIYDWLTNFGLAREADDLEATTDWNTDPPTRPGSLVMAGRFAQWKYFWTDDCVLRGRQIALASKTR